jgi:hypothetical protein
VRERAVERLVGNWRGWIGRGRWRWRFCCLGFESREESARRLGVGVWRQGKPIARRFWKQGETNEQSRDFGVGVCTAGKGSDWVWEHFVRFGDLVWFGLVWFGGRGGEGGK